MKNLLPRFICDFILSIGKMTKKEIFFRAKYMRKKEEEEK